MPKQEEFEFESYQDSETIKKYLESLIHGFESGKLTFTSEQNEIILFPKDLLKIKIKAKNEGDRSRLSLRISWKNVSGNDDKDKLTISTK